MLNRTLSVALIIASAALAIALFRHRPEQKSDGPHVQPPVILLEPAMAADLALLDRRIARVRLDDVGLDQAIRNLSEQAHVNICVDWPALAASVAKVGRMHVHLNDVTLAQALRAVLNELVESDKSAGLSVRDGVVTITTGERCETRTECFNIRAMIDELRSGIEDFPGFTSDLAGRPPRAPGVAISNEELVEKLEKCITETVGRESWRDMGGTIGSEREIAGILVITQTPENLAAVGDLLQQMQRAIHTRALPQIGVPIDTRLQSGAAVQSDPSSTQPVTQFINLRGLIQKLQRENPEAAAPPTNRSAKVQAEIFEKIEKLLTRAIDPDSWQDNGGKIGSINEIGPILAITQTPANLRAIQVTLDDLYHAISARDFIAATSNRPGATSNAAAQSDPSSTQPITQFIDLRGLIQKLQKENPAAAPLAQLGAASQSETLAEIRQLLTRTIDADSWQDNGGNIGSINEIGPILAITQTPANLRAARLLLDDLYHATSSRDFISATHPSAATTRESGAK